MGGDKENFAKPVQKTATQSSALSVVHLPIRASSISTAVSHPGPRSISGGLHQLPGATAIKDHKLGGLQNRTLEARCLKFRCEQGQLPSTGSRGGSFLGLSLSWSRVSLNCSHIPPTSASFITRSPPPWVCPSLLIRTEVIWDEGPILFQ